jgi:hypothetical protein
MAKNHNQLFVLTKDAHISNLTSGRDRAHLKIHDSILKLLVAEWEKWEIRSIKAPPDA